MRGPGAPGVFGVKEASRLGTQYFGLSIRIKGGGDIDFHTLKSYRSPTEALTHNISRIDFLNAENSPLYIANLLRPAQEHLSNRVGFRTQWVYRVFS